MDTRNLQRNVLKTTAPTKKRTSISPNPPIPTTTIATIFIFLGIGFGCGIVFDIIDCIERKGALTPYPTPTLLPNVQNFGEVQREMKEYGTSVPRPTATVTTFMFFRMIFGYKIVFDIIDNCFERTCVSTPDTTWKQQQ